METRRSWMDRETGPVLFQAHICPRNTFGKFGAKKYTTKTEDRWSKERETEIHFCAPIKDQLGRFRTSKYAFFTKAHYKQVLWLENEVKLSALLGKYGRQTNKSTDRPTTNQRTGRRNISTCTRKIIARVTFNLDNWPLKFEYKQ